MSVFLFLFVIKAQGQSVGFTSVDPMSLAPLVDNLQAQADRLTTTKSQTCESAYDKIFTQDRRDVRFDLYYGYLDSKNQVTDGAFALAMSNQLQKKCPDSRLQACGFQINKWLENGLELKRKIIIRQQIKYIFIRILSSSLSSDDSYNQDISRGYWDQKNKSLKIESDFYQSLNESQVVFYDGHARMGTGPGFRPTRLELEVLARIRKKSFETLLGAVSKSESSLRLFGYFACETDKYYSNDLLRYSPQLALIVTEKQVGFYDSEQAVFGAVNAVLSRQCEAQLNQSMVPASHPENNFNIIKNLF